MSHTVVYDQHENTKKIMNAVNSFARHCKIGKVRPKTAGQRLVRSAIQARDMVPFWAGINLAPSINEGGYMPKCGCKIGNACGNVACPHSPRVTC